MYSHYVNTIYSTYQIIPFLPAVIDVELFKDIPGYEGYQVTSLGRIYSKKSRKIIKPFKATKGYKAVILCKNGIPITKKGHRFVAQMFISNPGNYEQVNHKDGNTFNATVSNLEWCSASSNIKHSYKVLHRTPSYGNQKISESTILKIHSMRDSGYSFERIGKEVGLSRTQISRYINNKVKRYV